jgi:hypothetical protein
VIIVILAETTPVLEAANLQSDLNRADIHRAWVINNSIAAAVSRGSVTSSLLLQRARNELPKIEAVPQRHAARYAVVPLLAEEPIGADKPQLTDICHLRGRRISAINPPSGRFRSVSVPPCVCTTSRAIDNPSPVPPVSRLRECSSR